jgi:hypothetical protein
LLKNMKPMLERVREPEEMGFRAGYRCSDLVHSLRMLSERSNECGEHVWVASLDMEKAFDKVYHSEVLQALRQTGVHEDLIAAVRRLYTNQTAFVALDAHTQSRLFEVRRGVRQGDPLSPALFANTLRIIMSSLKHKWELEGCGSIVGSSLLGRSRLTHSLFADDTRLVARSRKALIAILCDILRELSALVCN